MANDNQPDKVIYSMHRVTKRHGQREVLKDISLGYFYGAKIGVLGLNGAGKSSLLKIMAGVDKAFDGDIVVAPGYNIGYLEQEPLVDETRTVREVVEEGVQEIVNLVKEFNEINERLGKCSLRATFFSSLTNPCTRFVNSLVYAGVGLSGALLAIQGAVSVGNLTSFLSYANQYTKPFNEISGVNTAMQGHSAPSGTPSSLYAQQAQNSSLNLKGLFGALTAFRRRRDTKLMQMIQQFYNDAVYLDIAGADYSEEAKWYNPEKAKNAIIDLSLTDGNNSPAYQMLQNDFAFQLFQAGAIDVKSLLENTTYPFATRLLEGIKRNEAEAQQAMAQYQQEAQGAMTQPLSPQMQMAMNNGNAGPMDGITQRV